MKAKEFDIKKRDPNWRAMQDIRRSGAGGQHKDKKRAAKQGEVKHKAKQFAEGVAEGQAGKEDLRKEIVDILERIYFDASSDDDMTDVISDQLGDYYQAVKVSRDTVLKRVYADIRDTADAPPEEQATVALAGIKKLMGPGYRPQPRPPLSPDQEAQVDAFVNQFKTALGSHGIKAHPDWNKDKKPGQGVAEGYTTEKQIMTRIRQIMHDRKLSGTDSNAGELHRLKQQLKDMRSQQGVEEGADELYGLRIGDTVTTELDGQQVQGDIIDIFPDDMEVELLLRGPETGRTIVVDVRDTEIVEDRGVAEGSDWGEPREILEDVLRTLEREVEWPLTEVMDPKEVRQLLSPLVRAVNDKLLSLDRDGNQ